MPRLRRNPLRLRFHEAHRKLTPSKIPAKNRVGVIGRHFTIGTFRQLHPSALRHPAKVSIDAAALGVKLLRELRYGDMTITWLTKL